MVIGKHVGMGKSCSIHLSIKEIALHLARSSWAPLAFEFLSSYLSGSLCRVSRTTARLELFVTWRIEINASNFINPHPPTPGNTTLLGVGGGAYKSPAAGGL